jgi:Tfp pilus assembly protein PilZ
VEEKRVHPRVSIDVDVTCEIKDRRAVSGVARDISLGGMFIESEERLLFGAELTIVARIPGTDSDARLPGIVRWNKPGGFGVQFGLLGARETHAITNLMKR